MHHIAHVYPGSSHKLKSRPDVQRKQATERLTHLEAFNEKHAEVVLRKVLFQHLPQFLRRHVFVAKLHMAKQ